MMRQQGLPCIICLNKLDLDQEGKGRDYADIYRACGYPVLTVSAAGKQGIERLKEQLRGRTTTVAGPSGVGKSTVVNWLCPEAGMQTGEISRKIERGKHTTRHAQLFALDPDTFICDTPGFTSLSLGDIEKEELQNFYPEFLRYEKECRFKGCSHVSEPVCGVRQALGQGDISRIRYENYVLLYEELKNRRKY